MGRDLHVSLGAVEWVALAYLLVLVATVATVGRIADAVGRKLLYVYGFGVFTAGSVLCGLAPTLPVLIAARVLQAIGAAMLQANSVALIAEAMPPSMLGRAIGVQGSAQALGLALGPAVGGILLSLGGWRLIFLVNLPAGVIGLALGWFLLPRSRSRRELGARRSSSAPCCSRSPRRDRSCISRSPAGQGYAERRAARLSRRRHRWPRSASSAVSAGSSRRLSISRSLRRPRTPERPRQRPGVVPGAVRSAVHRPVLPLRRTGTPRR